LANPPAIDGVRELLNTWNPLTRIGAAESVWAYNHDGGEVVPVLVDVMNKTRPEEVSSLYRVLKLLADIGPEASTAAAPLRKILENPRVNGGTRLAASSAWNRITSGMPEPTALQK
jgi:hypothetical protein